MSDGVTYLYTSDCDQYNGDFYGTVDMQRLPGTTVDRSPDRQNDPFYNWFLPESKNVYEFAGGTSFNDYGIAGMQYKGQGKGKERDLEVKKSWFFIGEEIVCVGSDITSTTGDPIETTILNHRILKNKKCFLTFNDKKISSDLINQNNFNEKIKYLHLTGNKDHKSDIGVIIIKGDDVHALYDHRKGTWNHVEIIPDHVCENDFMTIWFNHGIKPKNADYCYILLPGFNINETINYFNDPDVELLECSSEVHAVKNKKNGITGINFWKEATYCGITVNRQACIMFKTNEKEMNLSVSDPTNNDALIEIMFDFKISNCSFDDGIEILSKSPFKIKVNTTGKNGQSMLLKAHF